MVSEAPEAIDVVPFEEDEERPAVLASETLIVDLEGFEGPLDLLLSLARDQKLDITKISILQLAEQYLNYIDHARGLRIEVAADYLVMAAWLAYLKSRLLLPAPDDDQEMSGEEMAAHLAFQLRRLEAMREASEQLMERVQLGRDVFARGMPEGIRVIKTSEWSTTLYELLKSYSEQRQRRLITELTIKPLPVVRIEVMRLKLERLIGGLVDWSALDKILLQFIDDPALRRSALASGLAASLECVKSGKMEMRQLKAYAAIYLRKKPHPQDQQNKNAKQAAAS